VSTFVVATGTIDSEVKVNQVGDEHTPVANFRINANPGWFSAAAWRDLASKVPAQGTPVLITGKLSTRSYEKDGVKTYVTEIVASTIEVLGAVTPAGNPGPAAMKAGNPIDDESMFGD
jgi:single-stranded DNA-binding protein